MFKVLVDGSLGSIRPTGKKLSYPVRKESSNLRVILMILISGFMMAGDAAINIVSTAKNDRLCPGEFITFYCIANGSRLVWTLNARSEFSFDNLESVERIIHKPLSESYATLLPHGDGLWESTYFFFSLPSSQDMNVICFDGSASKELTISVDTGSESCSQTSVPTTHGDASINLTSTAQQNVLRPGEFITFLCIASGSRLVWTLNSMSEFSFDNLESVERIVHKPLSETYATLLPRRDGLWESTYFLLSLPSSGNMTVACFNGSDSEELTISVMAADDTNVTSPEVPTNVTSPEVPTNVMSPEVSSDNTDTTTNIISGNGGLKTWHIIIIVAAASVLAGGVV